MNKYWCFEADWVGLCLTPHLCPLVKIALKFYEGIISGSQLLEHFSSFSSGLVKHLFLAEGLVRRLQSNYLIINIIIPRQALNCFFAISIRRLYSKQLLMFEGTGLYQIPTFYTPFPLLHCFTKLLIKLTCQSSMSRYNDRIAIPTITTNIRN